MHYTQLFRSLREAKGLTIEELARLAGCHRNTVANVESGRPVKFKTIAELMEKLGYPENSTEIKSIALLWLEAVSGLAFSQAETVRTARKALGAYRSAARQTARQLDQAITRAGLDSDEIRLLLFAAQNRDILSIIASVRDLAFDLASKEGMPVLKAAEP